jgi:hypothetical protein
MDSEVMNQHGDALRTALLRTNGHTRDNSITDSPDDNLSLPFGEGDAKFTLRTKGLRENVSR